MVLLAYSELVFGGSSHFSNSESYTTKNFKLHVHLAFDWNHYKKFLLHTNFLDHKNNFTKKQTIINNTNVILSISNH